MLSQSFHVFEAQQSDSFNSQDIWQDYWATGFPNTFISQAAGNTDKANVVFPNPQDEFVNHKCYNTLAVANHNDGATALDPTSVFKNPASTHGDREMPGISANGTAVSAIGLTTNNTGTSFAAPAVAGAAALLQQQAPILKSWQEGVRAILLASAGRKLSGSTWFQGVQNKLDQGDGAGALNVSEACRIAQHRTGANSEGLPAGFALGNLWPADFPKSGINPNEYLVLAPSGNRGPTTVNFKIAIAWSSVIGTANPFYTIDYLPMDIDLSVIEATTGKTVGFSNSFDNSHEIVEFVGRENQVYRVRLHKAKNPDGLPDTHATFGIAWRSFPTTSF